METETVVLQENFRTYQKKKKSYRVVFNVYLNGLKS